MTTRNSSGFGLLLSLFTAVAAPGMSGCASLAVWSAPKKVASTRASPTARAASERFWQALHGGRYEELPEVLDVLTAAYLKNPNDAETAAYLGFSHIWRVSESARLAKRSPTVTDDITLSRKYFSDAVELAPHDARLLGFLGGMELAEGSIHGDEKLKRTGYFTLLDAKRAWPEFNLFTIGYSMSRLPFDDAKYQEALDYQWETLDVCVGERVNRETAAYAGYMTQETQRGRKRACWNSWIAPHNFEGFFLNMGDMLVKFGQPDVARRVYADARLSKTYAAWPYRDVLEERIAQAPDNVAVFRRPAAQGEARRTLMVQSSFACMACHQAR